MLLQSEDEKLLHSCFTNNMSVNFGIEFKTIFPFHTIYILQQNLPHNDVIHKYTLSKGSAGAVTGCGKSLAK